MFVCSCRISIDTRKCDSCEDLSNGENERKRWKDPSNENSKNSTNAIRAHDLENRDRVPNSNTNEPLAKRSRESALSSIRFYFPLDRRHAIATYFRLDGSDCWRRVTEEEEEEGVSYGIVHVGGRADDIRGTPCPTYSLCVRLHSEHDTGCPHWFSIVDKSEMGGPLAPLLYSGRARGRPVHWAGTRVLKA